MMVSVEADRLSGRALRVLASPMITPYNLFYKYYLLSWLISLAPPLALSAARLGEEDQSSTRRRPSKARPRVTSSAYSRSAPTGRPEASRETGTAMVRSMRVR